MDKPQGRANLDKYLQSGESDARIATLEALYKKTVVWMAKQFGLDNEAEDVWQEVCLRVEKNREGISDLDAYVREVAHNLYIDGTRRARRRDVSIEDEKTEFIDQRKSPEAQLLAQESRQLVDLAINALPKKLRHVIEVIFIQGFNYEEASRKLGKPVETIYKYRDRAIRRMRKFIQARQKKIR